jgi:uncharacterized protein (TIGR00251 family)
MVLPEDGTPPFTVKNRALLLKVKAFPKSERSQITGLRNGELVVRVRAPAQKGEANKELIKVLAKAVGVARAEVKILTGETSRHKVVSFPLEARSTLEDLF